MPNFQAFLIVAIVATVLSGCSNNTSTSPNSSPPGAGSTFIFHYYDIDSAGNALPEGGGHDTATITATGLSYQGKTDVFTIAYGPGTPQYRHSEANGDLSFYRPGDLDGQPQGWKTIPIATKGVLTYLVQDSTIPGKIPVKDTISYTYAGTKTLTLANRTFQTVAMAVTARQQSTGAQLTGTYYYVPELGIEIKKTFPATRDANGAYGSGNVTDLVDYTLK